VSMEKSLLMVMSNFVGGRCGWVLMPWIALRDVVWMFNARSANALDCGSYILRPPFFKLRSLRRSEMAPAKDLVLSVSNSNS
jgi:hypothetical protein